MTNRHNAITVDVDLRGFKGNFSAAQWYNCEKYEVSYKRIYKSASSSIVSLLGPENRSTRPRYSRCFTVFRDPYDRSFSIWKELTAMNLVTQPYGEYLEAALQHGWINKHQFPQVFWIQGIEDEDLNVFTLAQLTELCCWLGVSPNSIPHLNQRPGQHKHSLIESEIVRNLYGDDLSFINANLSNPDIE